MKYIKTFEKLNEEEAVAPEQFTLILSAWNPYLVPTKSLANRPNPRNYTNYRTTDDMAKALARDDVRWLNSVEHYYVTDELRDEWGWESGWGSKIKDVSKVFKDVDFIVKKKKYTREYKSGRGMPTITEDGFIALPVKK